MWVGVGGYVGGLCTCLCTCLKIVIVKDYARSLLVTFLESKVLECRFRETVISLELNCHI